MMNIWIMENITWIGPAIFGAIGSVWAYLTNRTNKKLNTQLQAIQVELQKAQVDTAHVELNEKVNKAVDAALERALRLHEEELNRINERYKSQIDQLKLDMEAAEALKEQALELANTYEGLITKLKSYNIYLKAVLDANDIKYKEEDEL
jgi:hypothetical protein